MKVRIGGKYLYRGADEKKYEVELYRKDTMKDKSHRYHFYVLFEGEKCSVALEEADLQYIEPKRGDKCK